MNPIKFGLHMMDGGQDTLNDMLDRVPMLGVKFAQMDLKWGTDPGKVALLNKAKAKGCLLVGKRREDNPNIDAPNMAAEALRYYQGINADSFTAMAQAYPQIDIWEGPNEIGIKIIDNGVVRMQKYAEFLYDFSFLIKSYTAKRAGLGGWAVGNPGELALWAYYGRALQACKDNNAVLTRHNYGPSWGDVYTCQRQRLDEAEFEKIGYFNSPVIISECGYDPLYNPNLPSNWKLAFDFVHTGIFGYWNGYLLPFTNELNKDSYVLFSTLFTDGTGNASAFDRFDVAHMNVPNSNWNLASAVLANLPTPYVPPSPYTHYVTAGALNVREFPWTGSVTPPILSVLTQNTKVIVYAVVKLAGMTYGWGLLSPNGNNWASMQYLAPIQ